MRGSNEVPTSDFPGRYLEWTLFRKTRTSYRSASLGVSRRFSWKAFLNQFGSALIFRILFYTKKELVLDLLFREFDKFSSSSFQQRILSTHLHWHSPIIPPSYPVKRPPVTKQPGPLPGSQMSRGRKQSRQTPKQTSRINGPRGRELTSKGTPTPDNARGNRVGGRGLPEKRGGR